MPCTYEKPIVLLLKINGLLIGVWRGIASLYKKERSKKKNQIGKKMNKEKLSTLLHLMYNLFYVGHPFSTNNITEKVRKHTPSFTGLHCRIFLPHIYQKSQSPYYSIFWPRRPYLWKLPKSVSTNWGIAWYKFSFMGENVR